MKKIFTAKELNLSRDSESPVSEKDLNRIAADISDMVRTALVKNEQVIRRKTHGKSGESLEASIENLVEDICREISAAIERKGYEEDYGALHWDSRRPWEQSVVAHVRRIASGDSAAPVKEDKAQAVGEAVNIPPQNSPRSKADLLVAHRGRMKWFAFSKRLEGNRDLLRTAQVYLEAGQGDLNFAAAAKMITAQEWHSMMNELESAYLVFRNEVVPPKPRKVAEARYQPTDAEARKWAKGWTVRMPFIPDAGTRHFGSEEEAVRYVDSKMGGFDAVVAFDGRAVKKKSAFGGWTKIEA